MRSRFGAIGALLVLAAGVPMAVTAAQPEPAKADAENGRRVYDKVGCYQCHGREAQGGAAGSRLGPNPWAYEQFVRYVRQPRGDMPPYTAKILTDAELADIYAFVRTRPKPVVPPR